MTSESAASSSSAKRAATRGLRAAYHAAASSPSATARGWNSRAFTTTVRRGAKATTNLGPGNCLRRPRINLGQSALGFPGPGLLDVRIRGTASVEAIQQLGDDLCALVRRQSQRSGEYVLDVTHGPTLLRVIAEGERRASAMGLRNDSPTQHASTYVASRSSLTWFQIMARRPFADIPQRTKPSCRRSAADVGSR